MSQETHETAPTRFVEANGIRFGYRRFGGGEGLPTRQNLTRRRARKLLSSSE